MALLEATDDLGRDLKRYSIHQLTEYFADTRLSAKLHSQRDERMITYFRDYVTVTDDWESATKLDALERERWNISKAMELCHNTNRMQDYVIFHRGMCNMLWARGYWHENISNGRLALAAALWLQDDEAAAWIRLESIGWTYFCQGKYELARQEYNAARLIFEKKEYAQSEGFARTCNYLGRLEMAVDNLDRARMWLTQGKERSKEPLTLYFLTSALGDIYFAQRDYNAARTSYLDAKQSREDARDDVRLCGVICRLGDLSLVAENKEARSYYEASLHLSRTIRRLEVEARSLRGLAKVELRDGDLDAARDLAKQAEAAFVKLGAEKEVSLTKGLLERIATEIGMRSNL